MVAIDPATGALVWQYGITGKPGAAPGELNTPDGFDLLLPDGSTPTHPVTGLVRSAGMQLTGLGAGVASWRFARGGARASVPGLAGARRPSELAGCRGASCGR